MKYRIAIKASPVDPSAASEPQPPEPDPEAAPAAPEDDARPWAGDPYDEGDETQPDDPAVTAVFGGQADEQAWLERADDGTLTGWVRDGTGQVWRYSDPDAWAIDVDDAKMTPSGADGPAEPEEEKEPTPPDQEEGTTGDLGPLTLDGFK
ncbi:hypothetical protein [Kitasatospora sp. NPDC088548]|uniref:hypothetical protein n=1 Tax=Kitasatospora sp. NPDC088548 TaxID=3364075 RepID=UPI0038072745